VPAFSLPSAADLGGPGRLLGNAMILAGVACCALDTMLARRLREGFSPLLTVTLQESLALGWAVLIWPVELSRMPLEGLKQIPLEAWNGRACGHRLVRARLPVLFGGAAARHSQ
jgi:drug/metabolite transporter (DMT)-like permease